MAFISEWFWYFLLIPLAAVVGWVIGRRGGERHSDHQVSRLSTTYFRGLNYLLNEQPDKAIELFLHVAELDKDTFETQVALGHLFRRRGEVDRAIRLHQGLVQAGLDPSTPAAIVENGGGAQPRALYGTLASITAEAPGWASRRPALVIVAKAKAQ